MDKKKKRPDCLDIGTCLRYAGNLSDTRAGWRSYLEYLDWLACSKQEQTSRHFDKMCTGWALGARAFKKAVLKDHAAAIDQWKGFEFKEARELYWDNLLDQLLRAVNKGPQDIVSDPKSASWKVVIAYYLKTHTAVTNGWISTHLNMGIVQGVSRYVSEFAKQKLYRKQDYKDICVRRTT